MDQNSAFLKEAYNQFILDLGGKKVPTPYRINMPFAPDREIGSETIYVGGKSSGEVLTQNTITLAKEQNFDLNQASVEEIRSFMHQNRLGVDCSGFVYQCLDYLLNKTGQGGMTGVGFPRPGQSNVEILTSEKFSQKIDSFDQIQPGDIIRLDSLAPDGIQHIVIVLEKDSGFITYAHSSRDTQIKGVHKDVIVFGKFPHDLHIFSYDPDTTQDGIYRLKALN